MLLIHIGSCMSWFRRKLISRERSNICWLVLLLFIDFTTILMIPDCDWVRFVKYWTFSNSCYTLKISFNLYHALLEFSQVLFYTTIWWDLLLMADTGIASLPAQGLRSFPSGGAKWCCHIWKCFWPHCRRAIGSIPTCPNLCWHSSPPSFWANPALNY